MFGSLDNGETQMTKPSKGMRFLHSRVLDVAKFDGKTPQLYQITKIARGGVYYRPVYDLGFPSERLGSPDFCEVAQFPRYCLSVA